VTAQLLSRLNRLAIEPYLDDTCEMHYRCRAGRMTPELRRAIKQRREEFLIYLQTRSISLAEEHDLRVDVLESAARAGFPRLLVSPAETVIGGMVPWARFIRLATPDKLMQAQNALAVVNPSHRGR
jgi:hypothetical protein